MDEMSPFHPDAFAGIAEPPDEPWAELAALAPGLHACLHRGLVGLAAAPAGHEPERRWRRRVRAALAPLATHLRARPADARLLIRWLFRHDHALLEDPATWARAMPGLPRPAEADLVAVADTALGLPPLPGDEALLRECEARQVQRGGQQIIGHPSAYPAIRALARHPRLEPDDEIRDLGAGHGRVVLYLAHLGRRARGIELLPDRHAVAEAARRARGLVGIRFDQGDVLDPRFWHGPAALTSAGSGWFYCYDPFDAATHEALLRRLQVAAGARPVRLVALVQTSRYRQRHEQAIRAGRLVPEETPPTWPGLGLHLFRVLP